jgi:hypothetical protein
MLGVCGRIRSEYVGWLCRDCGACGVRGICGSKECVALVAIILNASSKE